MPPAQEGPRSAGARPTEPAREGLLERLHKESEAAVADVVKAVEEKERAYRTCMDTEEAVKAAMRARESSHARRVQSAAEQTTSASQNPRERAAPSSSSSAPTDEKPPSQSSQILEEVRTLPYHIAAFPRACYLDAHSLCWNSSPPWPLALARLRETSLHWSSRVVGGDARSCEGRAQED